MVARSEEYPGEEYTHRGSALLIGSHTHNHALKLIESYLSERKFSESVNQAIGRTRSVKTGVPQGSLLGALLYILYTKEIEEIATKHLMKTHMYADDCHITVRRQ